MFFILSKLLFFLTVPLNWCIGLFIWSYKTKSEVRKKKIFIVALALLYLFSNKFLSDITIGHWEYRYSDKAYCPENSQTFDYAIVLGGMTWFDQDTKRIQFLRSGDRLFQAIKLLQEKKVKKIIFTGGSGSLDNLDVKEGENVRTYLKQIGIPDSLFIIESESNNTHENALFTKHITDKISKKEPTILLITSAFHMRRSLACFETVGFLNVTPYPTDYYASKPRFEFDHCFLPDTDALEANSILIHEIIGYFMYKVAGYC